MSAAGLALAGEPEPPHESSAAAVEVKIVATNESRVEVLLNGERRQLARGVTVAALVSELGRDPRTVAIEYNGEILPRARYESTEIGDGDRLEVVHFVQGG